MSTPTTYTTQITQKVGDTLEVINVTFEYCADFTGDGFNDVRVTLSLADSSNSGTEDMIGVAFDIQDDAVAGLIVSNITKSTSNGTLSTFEPTVVIGANLVSDGDPQTLVLAPRGVIWERTVNPMTWASSSAIRDREKALCSRLALC